MSKPTAIADLIEKLTPAALGEALGGMSAQGVSNMKRRGAIPPKHWPAVVSLANETPGLSDFSWGDLVKLHTDSADARQRESAGRNHPKQQAAG